MFRKTFLFAIDDLQGDKGSELREWIDAHQSSEIIRDNRLPVQTDLNTGDLDYVHAYEADIIVDTTEQKVARCLVVILESADWLNFTESLIAFSSLIFHLELERQHCYDFDLLDESSDFRDIHTNS